MWVPGMAARLCIFSRMSHGEVALAIVVVVHGLWVATRTCTCAWLVDLAGAGLGLVLLWPLFLLIAVLIKLEDGVRLFCQQRIGGWGGLQFWMWKFRSMRSNERGPLLTVAGELTRHPRRPPAAGRASLTSCRSFSTC